jgi:hypothetical protein
LQHQEFQQHKLVEFQQQSKIQKQVEKVMPMEDLIDSQQSTASYQRLVALKQIQQKQHYEHQLQQQYENRKIIEACVDAKILPPQSENQEAKSPCQQQQMYDNEITENELDERNYYTKEIAQNFTMSPSETTDCDSNYGDIDSEYSPRFINSNVQTNELNWKSMPILEDGLSSGGESDNENNNSESNYRPDVKSFASPSMNLQPQIYVDREDLQEHDSNNRISSHSNEYNEKSHEIESTLINIRSTLELSKKLSTSINDALAINSNVPSINNNTYASKESLSNDLKDSIKGEDEDTDLETDRLLGQKRINEIDTNKVSIVR